MKSVTPHALQTIPPSDSRYPSALKTCTAFKSPPELTAIGNLLLLQTPTIALSCSIKCPGDLILKTYDLAQALREAQIPVISGFHSPIEQDCLKILQRGTQPLIHCPARSIHNLRLSPTQTQAIQTDRLLILSPFNSSYTRTSIELAAKRNALVSALADRTFIAYAAPNSKTLNFAQTLIHQGHTVITHADAANQDLLNVGAIGLTIDKMIEKINDLVSGVGNGGGDETRVCGNVRKLL